VQDISHLVTEILRFICS